MQDALTRKAQAGPLIDQAKGMIMLAEGCTAEEAFELLRMCSQDANRKVADIARTLLEYVSGTGPSSDDVSAILNRLANAGRGSHGDKTMQSSPVLPLAQPDELHPSGNYDARRANGHRGHARKPGRREV